MNFQQKLAHIVLGHNSNFDLIKAAEVGLEEGLDSISLAITAGLSENENSLVLKEYFEKALKELAIKLPNQEEAMITLISYYSDKVLKHDLGVFEGITKIYEVVSNDCNSLHWSDFVGHYHEHDDLVHNWIRAENEEKQREWIRESEKAIIAELQNWKEKYKV